MEEQLEELTVGKLLEMIKREERENYYRERRLCECAKPLDNGDGECFFCAWPIAQKANRG